MKLDARLSGEKPSDVAAAAREAEAWGLAGLWTHETQHDPFLPLAIAAEHTERIEIGTAIAVAFARSPMVVAHTAWDLARWSGGRFLLGLGTQVRGHKLGPFTNLESLDLVYCPIDDEGMKQIGGLTKLRKLLLRDAVISDEGARHLCDLVQVEQLDQLNVGLGGQHLVAAADEHRVTEVGDGVDEREQRRRQNGAVLSDHAPVELRVG